MHVPKPTLCCFSHTTLRWGVLDPPSWTSKFATNTSANWSNRLSREISAPSPLKRYGGHHVCHVLITDWPTDPNYQFETVKPDWPLDMWGYNRMQSAIYWIWSPMHPTSFLIGNWSETPNRNLQDSDLIFILILGILVLKKAYPSRTQYHFGLVCDLKPIPNSIEVYNQNLEEG